MVLETIVIMLAVGLALLLPKIEMVLCFILKQSAKPKANSASVPLGQPEPANVMVVHASSLTESPIVAHLVRVAPATMRPEEPEDDDESSDEWSFESPGGRHTRKVKPRKLRNRWGLENQFID